MSTAIPRVAIVTRTKDRAITLKRTMRSIADQTYRDCLWIIVNDGGASEPVEAIALEARGLGVATRTVHRERSGRWQAANTGIAESESELLVLLDDDDTWEPGFLAETVAFLDAHPALAGVVTQTRIVNEVIEGERIRALDSQVFNPGLTSVYLIDLTRRNLFTTNGFVYRRSVLAEIGVYDAELPVLADWDFHLRFLERYDVGTIARPLANWHQRNSAQGDLGNTVLAGSDQHVIYDTAIRNRLLRRDLESGRLGLGVLANLGRRHSEAMNVLSQVDGVLDKLSRLARKSGLRAIVNRLTRS